METKVCDINATFCYFSLCGHTGLCDRDIYSIILTSVVRHSRECLTTVGRHSCERLTTIRQSWDIRASVSRQSRDIRASVSRLSWDIRAIVSRRSCEFWSVLFIAIKSRNGLIYVAYLSHCAERGNFLAMCLGTSAKGWRRVRDICDDLATVLRYFLSHKKVLHV